MQSLTKKPVVSIVIITIVRPSLYGLVASLLKQKTYFEFEIILIAQHDVDDHRLDNEKIEIFLYPQNRGVAYYRNQGARKANGEIIAFIDDDEMPKDEFWLKNLVKPILKDRIEVTSAGTEIPLKQGFLADSISLLGYPGGAALGFENLWKVDKENFTDHLCTGNFAIKKSVFKKLGGFSGSLKFGNEDVFLSEQLKESGIKILYIKQATVNHLPRKNLWEFIKWHFRRGRALAQYKKVKSVSTSQIFRVFRISFLALKTSFLSPYFFMVILLLPIQYGCQFLGLLYEKATILK